MAFRASELRLILGIQAYGTTNLARLRRDITALGRTAEAANLNQLRVMDQIAAKREQIAKTTQRIAAMESRALQSRAVLEAQAALAAERFAQRRATLAQKEISLTNQLANKRVQLGKQADRIAVMQGSGMQKFAVQETQLAQRRQNLQNQINTLQRQGISLRAQSLRQQAGEISAARRLASLTDEAQFVKLTSSLDAVQKLDVRDAEQLAIKEAALRFHAVKVDAERIAAAQSHLPAQIEAVNRNLAVTNEQEKLIQARKVEQAAAIGRANELYQAQQAQLRLIDARLADIAIEEKVIAAQEGLTNAQRAKGLAALEAESAELGRQRVILGELTAEEQRLAQVRMQQAIAADRLTGKAAGAERLEVLGRTVSHVGRTMQFTGLIGSAAFLGASAAAADLNRNAALAGTQMRDIGGTFQQATLRGEQLTDKVLDLSTRFPASAKDMTDAAYEIFSSMNIVRNGVVDVQEGFRLLEVANKAAVAGQVDLSEATTAMITVLNNFDPNLQNVGKRMNEVFSIVRFGRMRLSDFAEAMTPLAPIAKTLNLELTDVGSALSALTILFKSPQQAAQGLARAIELLNLTPFKKGLEEFDVDVVDKATNRMRPLHAIIEDLAKAFPEMTTGQKSAVELLTDISKASGMTKAGIQGTVQARRAIAGLVTSMDLYQNILNNVTSNQGEFNEAFKAMNATPGVQWAVFVNQLRAFALVVGTAALPVLLEFGDKLVNAAQWLQDLIDKTDGAIVKWGIWISVGALVGGTLLSIVGGIAALVANLRIATLSFGAMGDAAAIANTKASLLGITLRTIAGIGIISIPIVLQIMKGGEPGLWELLSAAGAGAIGGGMIAGPPGAAIGAFTLPLIVEVIAHFQGGQPKTALEMAWNQYQKNVDTNLTFHWPWEDPETMMSFDEFKAEFERKVRDAGKINIPRIGEDVARSAGSPKAVQKTKTLMQQYQQMFKNVSKEWMAAQQNLLDALTGGEEADDAVNIAKERARITEQAWKNMQQKIKDTADKLGQTYDQFRQMNEEMMGDLFKGPVLTGFLGSIFEEINGLLMQFGQTVPVPISLINRDLEMQIANFTKLREGYAELLRKGVPLEIVQEIQKMGIAGLPFVQGLVQASGPEFQKFVKNVKQSQKDIEKFTKIDFENQLAQWRKYGSDIASEIIGGLSSEAAQAKLEMGFEKYVTQLFGATFKKEMAKEIEDALAAAAEVRGAGKAAEKAGGKQTAKEVAEARAARNRLKNKQGAGGDTTGTTAVATPVAQAAAPPLFPIFNPSFGRPGQIINNYGDTNSIVASGVDPSKVTQAMNKNSFQKRNRKR